MKFKLIFFLLALLVLTGCNNSNINEAHKAYLTKYDWHVKKQVEIEDVEFDYAEEQLANYRVNNLTFFDDYAGQKVRRTIYELEEKDMEREHLKAVLYEIDGNVIGGHGIVPSWTPGVFHLNDKNRLLNEKMIQN